MVSVLWSVAVHTYLPSATSSLIPGIFVFHGGVYLTDRELFVWAAQDGTPEDNGEGMRRSPISVPQAVQAGGAMRMLLMLCIVPSVSYPRSIQNGGAGLTGHFRLSIVVRIDGGRMVVDYTPKRDNWSTPKPSRT